MNQLKLGIMLNYVSIAITFIVGLLYTPFLIRTLGQVDYGIYALALAVAGYLSLLDLGIGNAIVRYVAENQVNGTKENESKLVGFFYKIFSYIGLITIVLGLSISWNLGNIVSNDFSGEQIKTLQWMILILTINFAVGFILNTFSAVLQAYEKFIFLKLINVIRISLTPILSVIFLFYSSNIIILTTILAFVNIGALFASYYYYKKTLRIKMTFQPIESTLRKEIIKYSLIIFVVAIADKLYWQTDQILLGILKNPEVVAVYALAIQFVNIFMSLSIAINSVFLARVTHLVSETNYLKRLNSLFIKVSKFQTFVLGLFLSGFVLIGEIFIDLWVGESYKLAYYIVIILMSAFSLDLIQNLGLVIMQAKGKYSFRAYSLIICAILNVLISIPIIRLYGSIGTAVITSIFVFIGNVFVLNIYYHKVLKLNMINYWLQIGKLIVITAIIAAGGFVVRDLFIINNWLTLFIFSGFYSVVYCFSIYFLYLSKNEKLYLKNKLSGMKNKL
ncbi:oligosaccharide flippase family protein [Lysinibacillus sp. Ag94]|uniref:oligosaccharide flippase family protein n=1 Tax=Lysinibacillus sp. Ag94 TaxID=2936682 RepID=UPI00200C75FF|nr:oligosaccharide flippase family protein [Lysinibacillus sp. Ag94]UPW83707.1 oligosaccharide flippase family protein [Lysinibacillus sp. Ag94]